MSQVPTTEDRIAALKFALQCAATDAREAQAQLAVAVDALKWADQRATDLNDGILGKRMRAALAKIRGGEGT